MIKMRNLGWIVLSASFLAAPVTMAVGLDDGLVGADIRQEDRRADRQIDRRADRQLDRRADRQLDRRADRQLGRRTDRQLGRRSGSGR
jgi:hypothetical protein